MAEKLKFKDMPYERPVLEDLIAQLGALTERLKAAGSYEEAKRIFLEEETLERHVDTLVNLCYIRHSIDTRDEFYSSEQEWWDESLPLLAEPQQAWKLAMLASPFRPDFEAEYGNLMFLNAEIEARFGV